MKIIFSLAILFASSLSFAATTSENMRAEFQRIITEDVLPKVLERSQTILDQQAAMEFTGALTNFKFSFTRFVDTLCMNASEECYIARYTEGIELAHNLTLIPDVDPTQLVLPTRPFKRAEEFCTEGSPEDVVACIESIVMTKQNRLEQTRNPDLADSGVRMAQDYSHFAKYLHAVTGLEVRTAYLWNYDYALHYLEDRLSDY